MEPSTCQLRAPLSRFPLVGQPLGRVPLALLLSRDVMHIAFVSSNFGSPSMAVPLRGQVVPASVTDLLLESNIASIIGDEGTPLS